MNRENIYDGSVVELRNGDQYMLVDRKLVSLSGNSSFDFFVYSNDFLAPNSYGFTQDYDIMKINNNCEFNKLNAFSEAKQNKWTWIRCNEHILLNEYEILLLTILSEHSYILKRNNTIYVYDDNTSFISYTIPETLFECLTENKKYEINKLLQLNREEK